MRGAALAVGLLLVGCGSSALPVADAAVGDLGGAAVADLTAGGDDLARAGGDLGLSCAHDSDCRTCATPTCACVPAAASTTMDCSGGACFIDPCQGKSAWCHDGVCAIR
jgi:hypothetical protein